MHLLATYKSLFSNLLLAFQGEWCVDKGKIVIGQFTNKAPAQAQTGAASGQNTMMEGFSAPTKRDTNKWGF